MMGLQCNGPNCGIHVDQPNWGWWILAQNPLRPPEPVFNVFPGIPVPQPPEQGRVAGTFCSPRCLADFVVAQADVDGPATGTEPPRPAPPFGYQLGTWGVPPNPPEPPGPEPAPA